jgi:hypothetical protein
MPCASCSYLDQKKGGGGEIVEIHEAYNVKSSNIYMKKSVYAANTNFQNLQTTCMAGFVHIDSIATPFKSFFRSIYICQAMVLTHHSSICDVLQHDKIFSIYSEVPQVDKIIIFCSCCSATVVLVDLGKSALKFLTALYV